MKNEECRMKIEQKENSAFCNLHSAFRRGGRVVYRGGLENRFGLTADGGSNPSLSARNLRAKRLGFENVKNILPILIGLVIATVIFAILWRQGAFLKLSAYWDETKEEL